MEKIFGINKNNGRLSICKAKPENRGKGKCYHTQHIVLSEEQLRNGYVQNFNQKIAEKNTKLFNTVSKDNSHTPSNVTSHSIKTTENGKTFTKEELIESSTAIAEHFNNDDFDFIKNFSEKYLERIRDNKIREKFENNTKNISQFLRSDDPIAKSTREFLGKDVNIDDLSEILVTQVHSMTAAIKFTKRDTSMRRIVLSSLNNDMNKERYVASVMFFGGRCCYCNRTLHKNPPPNHQASGEHLTPISPENKNEITGSTRYGNMALACVRCNSNRKNQELVSWITETNCIKEEDKPKVLGRIKAFRKFALYSEYTLDETKRINQKIDELIKYKNSFKRVNKQFLDKKAQYLIKNKLKITLYDLTHGE